MIERDVREMLHRRAGDAPPSPRAWERVAERIATGEPEPLAPSRFLLSRRTRRPVVLSGLAAVVLGVVAAAAVLSDSGDGGTVHAGAPDSAVPEVTVATTAPATPGTFQSAAEAAARQWVRAAAASDGDGAWDLLATASRAGVGDRSRFDARLPEIAREWGAWDGARDVSYRVVVLVGDEVDGVGVLPPELPRLAVVVLTERSSAGGSGPPRVMSLPVRGTKDRAEVDPFADPVIALDPDPAQGVRVVNGLGAIAPPRARMWFVVDDRAAVGPDLVEAVDDNRQRYTFVPRPRLLAGVHTFTAVALAEDGDVASRSASYSMP